MTVYTVLLQNKLHLIWLSWLRIDVIEVVDIRNQLKSNMRTTNEPLEVVTD